MAAYYRQEPDQERRRAEFYAHMARVFEWDDWLLERQFVAVRNGVSGRDGRPATVEFIDRHTRAIAINSSAAPLEWLASVGELEGRNEAAGTGTVRLNAGLRLREEIVGAEISALKSQNLQSSGGGGQGRPVSDYKLDCIHSITMVQERVPAKLYAVLVELVYRDRWLWEGMSKKRRRRMIERIRRGLDKVAVCYGYMSMREVTDRWKDWAK